MQLSVKKKLFVKIKSVCESFLNETSMSVESTNDFKHKTMEWCKDIKQNSKLEILNLSHCMSIFKKYIIV